MGKPAARVSDMHTCALVNGVVPHVGGPISGPGCPTVFIGGLPSARVTDLCTCVGPPDLCSMGSSGVFIGGMPAARMGDVTGHGGSIVCGCFTVLIGETAAGGGGISGSSPPASAAVARSGRATLSHRLASHDGGGHPADSRVMTLIQSVADSARDEAVADLAKLARINPWLPEHWHGHANFWKLDAKAAEKARDEMRALGRLVGAKRTRFFAERSVAKTAFKWLNRANIAVSLYQYIGEPEIELVRKYHEEGRPVLSLDFATDAARTTVHGAARGLIIEGAAAIGQAIIPIPVVGAAVGAVVGTVIVDSWGHQIDAAVDGTINAGAAAVNEIGDAASRAAGRVEHEALAATAHAEQAVVAAATGVEHAAAAVAGNAKHLVSKAFARIAHWW